MENHKFNTMSIHLKDRRNLAFSEFGDPYGKSVFFFHGWPGARLQGAVTEKSARSLGVRIIAPDRPGFGLSDFLPGRSILDWSKDILTLADHLEIDHFSVLGLSGGAPYALACALKIPHRLISVGIISGIGPSDAPNASQGVSPRLKRTIQMCTYAPWLVRLSLWRMARKRQSDPEGAFTDLLNSLPEPDRKALSIPAVKPMAILASKDTFRNGTRGHYHEIRLFARPWGFQTRDIQALIRLWHGEEDKDILPITARRHAETFPNCVARFLPKEGHYSLYINRINQILEDLLQ
jgi:pimeloyl-ACP methyl ester carboxylesterase